MPLECRLLYPRILLQRRRRKTIAYLWPSSTSLFACFDSQPSFSTQLIASQCPKIFEGKRLSNKWSRADDVTRRSGKWAFERRQLMAYRRVANLGRQSMRAWVLVCSHRLVGWLTWYFSLATLRDPGKSVIGSDVCSIMHKHEHIHKTHTHAHTL